MCSKKVRNKLYLYLHDGVQEYCKGKYYGNKVFVKENKVVLAWTHCWKHSSKYRPKSSLVNL